MRCKLKSWLVSRHLAVLNIPFRRYKTPITTPLSDSTVALQLLRGAVLRGRGMAKEVDAEGTTLE
jgi:hypothetical protein